MEYKEQDFGKILEESKHYKGKKKKTDEQTTTANIATIPMPLVKTDKKRKSDIPYLYKTYFFPRDPYKAQELPPYGTMRKVFTTLDGSKESKKKQAPLPMGFPAWIKHGWVPKELVLSKNWTDGEKAFFLECTQVDLLQSVQNYLGDEENIKTYLREDKLFFERENISKIEKMLKDLGFFTPTELRHKQPQTATERAKRTLKSANPLKKLKSEFGEEAEEPIDEKDGDWRWQKSQRELEKETDIRRQGIENEATYDAIEKAIRRVANNKVALDVSDLSAVKNYVKADELNKLVRGYYGLGPGEAIVGAWFGTKEDRMKDLDVNMFNKEVDVFVDGRLNPKYKEPNDVRGLIKPDKVVKGWDLGMFNIKTTLQIPVYEVVAAVATDPEYKAHEDILEPLISEKYGNGGDTISADVEGDVDIYFMPDEAPAPVSPEQYKAREKEIAQRELEDENKHYSEDHSKCCDGKFASNEERIDFLRNLSTAMVKYRSESQAAIKYSIPDTALRLEQSEIYGTGKVLVHTRFGSTNAINGCIVEEPLDFRGMIATSYGSSIHLHEEQVERDTTALSISLAAPAFSQTEVEELLDIDYPRDIHGENISVTVSGNYSVYYKPMK